MIASGLHPGILVGEHGTDSVLDRLIRHPKGRHSERPAHCTRSLSIDVRHFALTSGQNRKLSCIDWPALAAGSASVR